MKNDIEQIELDNGTIIKSGTNTPIEIIMSENGERWFRNYRSEYNGRLVREVRFVRELKD